jgi:hypothetical protein
MKPAKVLSLLGWDPGLDLRAKSHFLYLWEGCEVIGGSKLMGIGLGLNVSQPVKGPGEGLVETESLLEGMAFELDLGTEHIDGWMNR